MKLQLHAKDSEIEGLRAQLATSSGHAAAVESQAEHSAEHISSLETIINQQNDAQQRDHAIIRVSAPRGLAASAVVCMALMVRACGRADTSPCMNTFPPALLPPNSP